MCMHAHFRFCRWGSKEKNIVARISFTFLAAFCTACSAVTAAAAAASKTQMYVHYNTCTDVQCNRYAAKYQHKLDYEYVSISLSYILSLLFFFFFFWLSCSLRFEGGSGV